MDHNILQHALSHVIFIALCAVDPNQLVGSTPYCTIDFKLTGMANTQTGSCTAQDCHFAKGNPSFLCDTVSCQCPNGCPGYEETFKQVHGKVTFDCITAGSNNCSLVVSSVGLVNFKHTQQHLKSHGRLHSTL